MNLNTHLKQSAIFSSTIIATIGRPTLARAVESVLSQEVDSGDFEVIVVNDSGHPLPVEKWQESEKVTILTTQKRERCFARNAGAAIARDQYLHFLDDDDWILPEALKELWAATRISNALLICGTTRFIDMKGNITRESISEVKGDAFAQAMAGKWIPFQSSLIKSEGFFNAGGFDFHFSRMGEQKDLCRRLALHGDFAHTRHILACVVRDRENSTANWALEKSASLRSRDFILDERGSFARMVKSAKTSYWRGRLVRAYLTCVVWNLKQKSPLKMVARACEAIAGFILSTRHILSRGFWKGILEGN